MNIKPKTLNQNSKALKHRKRTLSRLMAIQTLYQFDFYNEEKEINEIKDSLIDNYVIEQKDRVTSFRKKIDLNLIETLLNGIQLGLHEIDHEISGLLKDGWNLEMLPDISLYILRFGSFELKYMKDVPMKVVIDEYVDISASFFEQKQVTFLNGTLENLAKFYRAEEFEKFGNQRFKTEIVIKSASKKAPLKPSALKAVAQGEGPLKTNSSNNTLKLKRKND